MKNILMTLILLGSLYSQQVLAAKKLSRELVFDGSNVNGQYHSAGEAVAKVEQEKKMNNLIGIRQDYKDRLSAERERLQRGQDGHSSN